MDGSISKNRQFGFRILKQRIAWFASQQNSPLSRERWVHVLCPGLSAFLPTQRLYLKGFDVLLNLGGCAFFGCQNPVLALAWDLVTWWAVKAVQKALSDILNDLFCCGGNSLVDKTSSKPRVARGTFVLHIVQLVFDASLFLLRHSDGPILSLQLLLFFFFTPSA